MKKKRSGFYYYSFEKIHSCCCHQSAEKVEIHFHIKMVEWHLRRLYCLNFTYDSIIDAISASVINVAVAQPANYLPSNGLNGRRKKRTHNLCKQWKKIENKLIKNI